MDNDADWSAEIVKLRKHHNDLITYLNAEDYDNARLALAEYRITLGNIRLIITDRRDQR